MRATGVIYDRETQWPFWRLRPLQMAVTGGVIVAIVATALAPYTDQPRFRWLAWGGVVATAAWVLGSAAYAFYIENFANYNEVYGSLGAIVGFLIWLWLSNLAMLFGAELNAEIDRRGQTAY
jgi:membrane protein